MHRSFSGWWSRPDDQAREPAVHDASESRMTSGVTPVPKPEGGDDLRKEAVHLRHCRRGFLLLAAGLLLALFAPVFLSSTGEGDAPASTPRPEALAAGIGILVLAIIPGAAILFRHARSPRWRQGGACLGTLALIDVLLLASLTTGWVPNADGAGAAARLARLLIETGAIVEWLQLWWIAVLISEFARACRAARMVRQTERLGGCVIVGLSVAVAHAAWVTPAVDAAASDGIGASLQLLDVLLQLAALLWTLHLLSSSAMLARLLAERSSGKHGDSER